MSEPRRRLLALPPAPAWLAPPLARCAMVRVRYRLEPDGIAGANLGRSRARAALAAEPALRERCTLF